jgi:hypothetical protein
MLVQFARKNCIVSFFLWKEGFLCANVEGYLNEEPAAASEGSEWKS